MRHSNEMSDLDKQIVYLEQFIKFAEKMIRGASSLEQTFEMQDVIFDTQIQLGMLILEKVRIVKNEKFEEMKLVPGLEEELRSLNAKIKNLEEEIEKWLTRRVDDEINQSDEMGRELEEMLNRLGLLSN